MAKYRKPGTGPSRPVNPAEQEDIFVAKTLEAAGWAQRNRPILTAAVVIVGLGVASMVYYARHRTTLNIAAAGQLEELQMRLEQGDVVAVRADLELFLERFGSTDFSDEARLTLGQILAAEGDHQGAADILEPLAGDVRSPLGAQAAVLLAAVAEDMGDVQVAEGLYERLADRARLGFQRWDALADAARLRRERGDYAGALEIYDRLLEEMEEGSLDRDRIVMWRSEVAARAGSGG